MLEIYNLIWLPQLFPDSWKEAIVTPVIKPNKNSSSSTSYRPIALTCNMCKILEKIISKRIRWYLESNQVLFQHQYGFRQHRSATDCLVNLESEICDALAVNNSAITVALDLEKAYKMMWQPRALKAMEKLNTKGNALAFSRNLLTGRTIRVKVNGVLSDPTILDNGVPTGSVRSVIVCLVSINEVVSVIERRIKGYLFADNLTIVGVGNYLPTTYKLIQNTLNNLLNQTEATGFKIPKNKSEYIIFTKKRKPAYCHISLNGQRINKISLLRILGMTFDNKFTWKTHINKL